MATLRLNCRVFKTRWFSKAAKKVAIGDEELCSAIQQVMLGQAVNLGGGVFKKRIGKNLYRSIVVTHAGRFWVFEYLFAKKDRDNIGDDELAAFRRLAKAYAGLTNDKLDKLVENGDWTEICDEKPPQI